MGPTRPSTLSARRHRNRRMLAPLVASITAWPVVLPGLRHQTTRRTCAEMMNAEGEALTPSEAVTTDLQKIREEEAKRVWLARLPQRWKAAPSAEVVDGDSVQDLQVRNSRLKAQLEQLKTTSASHQSIAEAPAARGSREELKAALESRNSITEEPGRRGRFSRSWLTLQRGLEQDAGWLQLIGDRSLDALDDALFRNSYVKSHGAARSTRDTSKRQQVVVLGSGWGANAVLSQLKNANNVDVTVISPRNYFLFTPMLAGAALGTLEPRSIIEPIRAANPQATYFEAEATQIHFESLDGARWVTCESIFCDDVGCEIRQFEVPYDQLVVAVGASTNTFGVKGVKVRLPHTRIHTCRTLAATPTPDHAERAHACTQPHARPLSSPCVRVYRSTACL